jgi:pimeloyl-ACP methyl ester carboxylesterase
MSQPPASPSSAGPRRSTALVVALVLTLVAVVVLAGAGAWWVLSGDDDPETERSASSQPAPPEPEGELPAAPEGLAAFYDQELTWEECGNSECTDLTVPLDYAEPDGETIELAVLRLPARDRENRVGQLVVNPGGPGASGVEIAEVGALVLGTDLSRSYDTVGFDPRGVGESEPITCSTEALDEFLAFDASPDDQAEVEQGAALTQALGEDCVKESGVITEHASTVETVRDMDVLRAALGEPELDYLGFSYGTKLGSTYAELFPDNVGRMVLDGAVGPDIDIRENALGQATGFQTALDAYLADCVEQGECPLGDSVEQGQQTILDFVEERDDDPLPTDSDRELTSGLAYGGVVQAMYAEQLWPVLTEALAAGLDGDGAPLLSLADQYSSRTDEGYSSNLLSAFFMIQCLDLGPTGVPASEVPESFAEFDEASPTFGRSFAYALSSCEDWPVESAIEPPTTTGAGAPPIVVIGTTRDPATPYFWAVDLAEALESGVLVTRDGDGHLGFNRGNECVDSAVIDYLLEGTVPDDGLEC